MDRFFRLAPSCAVLICVLAALPGCSTLKETSVWKKTSGLYYTYVNRPIKLDLTSAEALPGRRESPCLQTYVAGLAAHLA